MGEKCRCGGEALEQVSRTDFGAAGAETAYLFLNQHTLVSDQTQSNLHRSVNHKSLSSFTSPYLITILLSFSPSMLPLLSTPR